MGDCSYSKCECECDDLFHFSDLKGSGGLLLILK